MILEKIMNDRRAAVEALKLSVSISDLEQQINNCTYVKKSFYEALAQPTLSLIAEVKRASPSKGMLCEIFDPVAVAVQYEQAGASAISVLTEPKYFLGKNEYLSDVKQAVSIPVLRKEFIFDQWQVLESKAIGADAILLIASVLSGDALRDLLAFAGDLGLDCLVETRSPQEIDFALQSGARIIGVNNRDLNDFSVDLYHSCRMRSFVPPEILFVAESGIHTALDAQLMRDHEVNAILVGESVVTSGDIQGKITELMGGADE